MSLKNSDDKRPMYMGTRIIKVTIERAENNFSAFIPSVGGIAVTGSSIEEIKTSMKNAIDDYLEICKETGSQIPEEMSGEYELTFEIRRQEGLKLSGRLSKYKGVASDLTPESVADDPRAKHALDYD